MERIKLQDTTTGQTRWTTVGTPIWEWTTGSSLGREWATGEYLRRVWQRRNGSIVLELYSIWDRGDGRVYGTFYRTATDEEREYMDEYPLQPQAVAGDASV